ncbi:MAG: 50S ribosomal protein L29 [Candidatus Dependentiae bacterium]
MKISKIKEEFAQMSVEQLAEKLENLRRELFSLRLNASTAHIKDYSQFKKMRRNIARTLTAIGQRINQNN